MGKAKQAEMPSTSLVWDVTAQPCTPACFRAVLWVLSMCEVWGFNQLVRVIVMKLEAV